MRLCCIRFRALNYISSFAGRLMIVCCIVEGTIVTRNVVIAVIAGTVETPGIMVCVCVCAAQLAGPNHSHTEHSVF